MTANGRVFLVNTNGIIFGAGSRVDVAGLVASTLDISNNDFLNGKYEFTGNGGRSGFIVNQGALVASQGGFICLLGQAIDNRMSIQADLGTVALAVGNKITLSLENSNAISVLVDDAVREEVLGPDGSRMADAIVNTGTISAAGGTVVISAQAVNRIFDYAINNAGIIQATDLVEREGCVELVAFGSDVRNAGLIQAFETYIEVSSGSIINTPSGRIVADGASAGDNGGVITLAAASVLQQGLISANSGERGTAGSISISGGSSVVLDSGSVTSAAASGLAGNGGSVIINAESGDTTVKKNALVDFSAGSVSGNGGVAKFLALQKLEFRGILNGRAATGFVPGFALLDPEMSSVSGEFSSNTVVYSPNDITIDGDIYVTGGGDYNNFALLADHNSETIGDWNDGNGRIINAGNYSIGGERVYLVLRAGSGIGTMENPVLTDVSVLSAAIGSSSGDVFIVQGARELNLVSISSPGLVYLKSAGAIVGEYYDGQQEIDHHITADSLYLEAYGGIYGNDRRFSTSVNDMAVVNTGWGVIDIENAKSLNLLAAVNDSEGGEISLSAAGDMSVINGIVAAGEIELTANNIHVGYWADIASLYGGSVSLTATEGVIDRIAEPGFLASWDFGEGYSFDGTNYFDTGYNFGFGTGALTLIVQYAGTQSAPYVGIVGATPGWGEGYTLESHNGHLRYWLNGERFDSPAAINDGRVYQLSMVRDGTRGGLNIFTSNAMEHSYVFDVPLADVDTSNSFWIGGWGNTGRLAEGTIYGVRVYNTAMSPLEIYAKQLLPSGTGTLSANSIALSAVSGVTADIGPGAAVSASASGGDVVLTGSSSYSLNGAVTAGGSVDVSSDGDLTFNGDITCANELSLIADADMDGEGSLIIDDSVSEPLMSADYFVFQGANLTNIQTDGENGLSLTYAPNYDAGTMRLYSPGQDFILGLSLTHTGGQGMTVSSLMQCLDSIIINSFNDIAVYENLRADTIQVYADADGDLSGSISTDGLTEFTGSHLWLMSAQDLVVSGNTVYDPGEDFGISIAPATGSELGSLSVESTAGSITVDDTVTRSRWDCGIGLYALGNIVLNAPVISAGVVSLFSYAGSILGNVPAAVQSASSVYLLTGGTVASLSQPLDIDVDGICTVSAFSAPDGVSGALTGTTSSGDITVLSPTPGTVYFNGVANSYVYHDEGGGEGDGGSGDSGPVDSGIGVPDVSQVLAYDPQAVNSADIDRFQMLSPIGSVYFYHPIAETDMVAFEQLSAGVESYRLYNGMIDLIGNDALLKFFSEFEKSRREKAE